MTVRKPPPDWISSSSPLRWLTHAALFIAVVVLIARLMIPDALRYPDQPIPGLVTPASPGPATGLVIDLLAIVPALLVLTRRAIDGDFRLSLKWSHLPLFALLCWALLSRAWASDRFAAGVSSAHFFAAGCLLWAMSQLVRTPAKLRLVASVCFGLLMVMLVQTVLHQLIDRPATLVYFNQHKEAIFSEQKIDPDSFNARQFEKKVISGEIQLYFKSANTVAAVALLLFTACAGIGLQRFADGDGIVCLTTPVIAAAALTHVLIAASSKTSFFTPFIGVAIVVGFFIFQKQLRAHHRRGFITGVVLVALATIAIVGHGLYHHGLFPGHLSSSLDFRWKYWIASAGIFRAHPILGIGWDNYALHYLAYRVPEATEAIRDPHNFLVHFFVELGLVGGLLSIAWLLRLAWELTTPSIHPNLDSESVTEPISLKFVAGIITAGWLLSTLFTVDFSVDFLDIVSLLMRPILLLLVLLFAILLASMKSRRDWLVDPRPGPWIFWCLVTGLGLFLLHNAIDFSMFEPPALFLFMALIGTAQGMSAHDQKHAPAFTQARPLAIGGAIFLSLVWLTAAFALVAPVVIAEQHAADANTQIQTAPLDNRAQSAAHFRQALDELQAAWQAVPYNSDYAIRLARLHLSFGQTAQAEPIIARIKLIDPRLMAAWLLDAQMKLKSPTPDRASVLQDYETVLALSPNDVEIRMEYAQTLDRFGEKTQAIEQYERALAIDAKLPTGEPNRLSASQIEDLKKAIAADRRSLIRF